MDWKIIAGACGAVMAIVCVRDYLDAERFLKSFPGPVTSFERNRNSPRMLAFRVPTLLLWYTVRYTIISPFLVVARIFGYTQESILLKMFRSIGAKQRAMLAKFYQENVKAVEGHVWVCSFMKSGTNFGMQIVNQIAYKGDDMLTHKHLMDVVPWPGSEVQLPGRAVPFADCLTVNTPTGKMAIKTHMAFQHVPASPSVKKLLIIRDPKDVAVSAFYFLQSVAMGPMIPPMEITISMFLQGEIGECSWWESTASYWAARNQPECLLMFYEDMVQDVRATVEKVAKFMNVSLTDAELAVCAERSSFSWMKRNEILFDTGKGTPIAYGEGLLRKGVASHGEGDLTAEQRRLIDQTMMNRLTEIKSDFPYAERYMGRGAKVGGSGSGKKK